MLVYIPPPLRFQDVDYILGWHDINEAIALELVNQGVAYPYLAKPDLKHEPAI